MAEELRVLNDVFHCPAAHEIGVETDPRVLDRSEMMQELRACGIDDDSSS